MTDRSWEFEHKLASLPVEVLVGMLRDPHGAARAAAKVLATQGRSIDGDEIDAASANEDAARFCRASIGQEWKAGSPADRPFGFTR